ncbi:MAG: hypothetical protein GW947_03060 [Candidatus Pacebacteria bacterium]|nr:hypothetical protein [Candidatus Paceibacterota bacterium]
MKRYLTGWSGSWVVFLVLIACSYLFLRIQTIVCHTTAASTCPDEQLLAKLKTTSLFFTDFTQHPIIVAYAAEHNLELERYELRLPQTLVLYFQNKPLAYTIQLDSGELYGVSESGTSELLTASATNSDVLLKGAFNLSPELHTFLQAFVARDKTPLLTTTLIAKPDFVELKSTDGVRIFLPYTNSKMKIEQLQQILQSPAVTELDEPLREIDLRFDLPLLRTQQ